MPAGEEDIHRDLLPTEAVFRVAGTVGMVLGDLVFVLSTVPVSVLRRGAGESGGLDPAKGSPAMHRKLQSGRPGTGSGPCFSARLPR